MAAKGPGRLFRLPDGSPERLEGGYKNELLRYGDLVVRLVETTPESARWEHELLRFLARSAPEVVVPLAEPELAPDGRVATLLPYVDGEQLDRDDEGQRLELAGLLARLHRAGLGWAGGPRPGVPGFADLDLVRNRWWDWELVEKPPVLVRAFEATLDWLFDPPPLAVGAVHGDVYRGNVRVRAGAIVGVIDWEDARVDWPAAELANATWEVCKVGDALDPERAASFLAAYARAGGPGERDFLEPLLRLRLMADLLYSLTSKARGEPYDPRHVEHLLRALEQIDG
jgi:Ser/Thr protein kinase RdoA (MazF antagonist)